MTKQKSLGDLVTPSFGRLARFGWNFISNLASANFSLEGNIMPPRLLTLARAALALLVRLIQEPMMSVRRSLRDFLADSVETKTFRYLCSTDASSNHCLGAGSPVKDERTTPCRRSHANAQWKRI